ncbi:hypothetical protein ERO13_A09G087800v2 [Gossypium hirsutum]|uniref:Late embryogenesis abundant protein LEA-2 subgroup domain-containing protein n=3 Tax=Gossypium TaxID=3633 RepID=A0ABR0NQ69_GOSAR|nr:uncharacterized protein At1g08160-like [Gossypium hirsutum]XP_017605799.1 uncharacterized protein At1g08160 [Gossypium arboreum]KAG4183111.1 hypothetical protein ERO13_A09G087800v2 [Gossypium hirsutum]KAK5803473.1 hypothetical protein PVK06_031120 [Gossypium arboreum]TYJ18062.1 hypothetical protein E1A91_A09G096100v1 [Gossypium mustelinum]
MAGNTAQATQQPVKHFNLVRCVAVCLLTLIVLVGLAVLITWLVIRPKRLVYTLENGSLQHFNLNNNHINATFDFVLMAYNPNTKTSVYYDSMESVVSYKDQTLAFDTIDPFHQPHRDTARVESKLVAQNLALSPSTFKDLRGEKSSGEIEVDVHYKSRVRFKVGMWKSKHRTLKIVCPSVKLHFSWSRHFENVPCEVEL